jgi:hypothetical protein
LSASVGPTVWYTPANAYCVAADANYVYWADCQADLILRASRIDQTISAVTQNLGFCPTEMQLDGGTLWFTAMDGEGLYSIDTTQVFPATPTLRAAGGTHGLAIGAEYVYFSTWTVTEKTYFSGSGNVCRARKDDPSDLTCLPGTPKGPISLALDGDWLYFVSEGSVAGSALFTDGAIYRVAADLTGPPYAMIQNVVRPRDVAVTSDAVFWMTMGTNSAFGAVYGLAK